MHGLRRAVLQQRLSPRQPHPGLERPRLAGPLAGGHRAAARHQQLPGVHRPPVPGAVRGRPASSASTPTRSRSSRSRSPSSTGHGPRGGSPRSRRRTRPASGSPSSAPGPSGLAAAQQLTRAGHHVVVHERADRIGGLLRYGIPEFKMEKRVLERRLGQMEAEGTVFRTVGRGRHRPAGRRSPRGLRRRRPRRRGDRGPRPADPRPRAGRHPPGDGVPPGLQPGAGG